LLSSFPSSICWRCSHFSLICLGLICQKSVGCRCVGLCFGLLFWSLGLTVCFCANTMLFLLLCLCCIVWSWVLWCLQALDFLLRIALAIQGLLCFCMYFKIEFYISMQSVIEILIGLHWTCRLILVLWPFSQYWFYRSMSMEGLSIFWCLLRFLSSVVLIKKVFDFFC
jgi:hypothetical protein